MFAHDLHVTLAAVSVAAVAAAGLEGVVRSVRGRPPSRISSFASGVVLVLVGMTAAGGLAMLVRGERPLELLHLVYAGLLLTAFPVAQSLTAGASARARGLVTAVAALICLVLILRLFATG